MLSPNMTIDFPLFIPCLIFYLFSCSAFFFLFRWCLWSFPVFAVKLLFSVAAFMLPGSLIIIYLSNKSLSWVVFCCTSLWLESREQWILSDVSWLLTLLHSTTTFCFANCCGKEWITLSLFFNCFLRNVMSSCNCFIRCSEFSAKTSLPEEIN